MNQKRVNKRARVLAKNKEKLLIFIKTKLNIKEEESILEGVKRITYYNPQPIKDFLDIESEDLEIKKAQGMITDIIIKIAGKVL
jgi:hypothetical protein